LLADIEVWDKDEVSKNDLIGQGSLALTNYFNKPQGTEWVNLSYKVFNIFLHYREKMQDKFFLIFNFSLMVELNHL
jgi:hypothetical protein